MALLLPGGGVQRCGAVPGREPVLVPESVDITGIGEEPGRTDRSDSVQVSRGGTALGDQLLQFFVRDLDPTGCERPDLPNAGRPVRLAAVRDCGLDRPLHLRDTQLGPDPDFWCEGVGQDVADPDEPSLLPLVPHLE
jgi:hypothetical protein